MTIERRLVLLLVLAAGLLALVPAHAGAAPNDALYGSQFGPGQVRAEAAWNRSVGEGAVIAIVDSGVDLDHEDLAGKTLAGNTFLDCGASGCGNGDWQSGSRPADASGEPHGTHVAGISGAATGNALGIAGVAPNAKLMAVRVLDSEGSGSFEDIALGIRYAADAGADVINLSLGALPGVQGFVLTGLITDAQEAIAYATAKGTTVVAAAGNEGFPLCGEPGFDAGAVCVGATDRRELKASYSNFPIKPGLDAVSAPGGELTSSLSCGEGILSTVPAGTGLAACGYPASRAYDEYAGTSMASPHVAGVAALLSAQGCSRDASVSILRTTSRQGNTETRGVYTPVYGYGIVDADAATQAASSRC